MEKRQKRFNIISTIKRSNSNIFSFVLYTYSSNIPSAALSPSSP